MKIGVYPAVRKSKSIRASLSRISLQMRRVSESSEYSPLGLDDGYARVKGVEGLDEGLGVREGG